MLSNPLDCVMLGNKTLDYFRFAIGPQNIDAPARPWIFPRHESWSLLGHPTNMRPCRHGSSQLSCHNQEIARHDFRKAAGEGQVFDPEPVIPDDF